MLSKARCLFVVLTQIMNFLVLIMLFSSPEPKVRRPSVRRPFTMLKHLLFKNRLANQSQILCGASLGRGTIFCSRHLGHMTDLAATPIYGQNPSKIFFSRTGGPIFTKLGMQHRGLQPIIVCSNDDPGVTLTYFTARSNLVT